MSTTQERDGFPIIGWESNRYFVLDLDKQTSLDEVKKIAYEIGYRYKLGNCLIVHSSDAKQLMVDGKCLQNYNLVYGKRFPWNYQMLVLKELKESGLVGDLRYFQFRKQEKTSTLRVSPKDECKPIGTPVDFIEITGENEGIREYLFFLNIGRQVEKDLREHNLLQQQNCGR